MEQGIKKRNTYTSTILKFKLKKNIQKNSLVATLTNGRITMLEQENLKTIDEFKKSRSMDIISQDMIKSNQQKERVQIKGEENKNQPENDSLFAGSSDSCASSLLDDQGRENLYQRSVVTMANIKKPEDLIDKDLLNLLSYIKRLPDTPQEFIKQKSVEIGEITRHRTLIWDLDETLIHAQFKSSSDQDVINPDFEITLSTGGVYGISMRPYLHKTLEHLSQYYEMLVFTAAEKEYADLIIDKIDPEKTFFKKRLYRDSCYKCEDAYIKDLRIIEDRELEDIVIVDNSIISFSKQLNNGIPICAFYTTNKYIDTEMLYLITYLEDVFQQQGDLRDINNNTFKLSELLQKVG